MDGKLFRYDTMLAKHKIAFYTANGYAINIVSNKILFRNLTLSKVSFIIGLNFLLSNEYGLIVLKTSMYILHQPFHPLALEVSQKCGRPCPHTIPRQCK